MYAIYSRSEENTIYFEGNIRNAESLKSEIMLEIQKIKHYSNSEITIELSKLSFITTEGIEILAEINQEQPIKFKGYSVYIGMLLNQKNLVNESTP